MKNWTNALALALTAATLTFTAACTEDGPGSVADVPAPEPGDPAIYAPDGWPFQIGDRMSSREKNRRTSEFKVPGITWVTRGATSKLHLVGDRVYAPRFEYDPTKLGDFMYVYRGHFPVRLPESMRVQEPDMPPEFHGKIEYYTPEPFRLTLREFEANRSREEAWSRGEYIGRPWDDEGRLVRIDPFDVPRPPNRLMWPDYPERRK